MGRGIIRSLSSPIFVSEIGSKGVRWWKTYRGNDQLELLGQELHRGNGRFSQEIKGRLV